MAAAASPQHFLSDKSPKTMLAAIFSAGFFLRFGFVLWLKTYVQVPGNLCPYPLEVSSIAAHIARGQGFSSPFLRDTGPTAWIGPVYPYFVAMVFKLFGIYTNRSALVLLGIQCLMGAATGVVIYSLAKRTLGEKIGLWSAWIWTVSPIFFRWPASWIWDFTASALLLALILTITLDVEASGIRRQWLLMGLLWGVAALTNPALLSVLPISFGYALFGHRWRAQATNAALALALFAAVISPWAIRNAVVFGHPVFLRSNFWFEFHIGNYHYSNGMGYLGFHPGSNPWQMQKYIELGEQGYINWSKQQALSFVRQYPKEFLDLTLHRMLWFWDGTSLLYLPQEWWKPWEFWPFSATAWLGWIFLLTRRPRGWVLYSACMVVYPLPYYIVYPIAKYRHAIEPEMLLLSIYLASVLWSEVRGLRKGKPVDRHDGLRANLAPHS